MALGVLALILGAALGGVGGVIGGVGGRAEAAWATEMARSVLDEYSVRRGPLPAESEEAGWRYSLERVGGQEGLTEVRVTVWRAGTSGDRISLSLLLPEARP